MDPEPRVMRVFVRDVASSRPFETTSMANGFRRLHVADEATDSDSAWVSSVGPPCRIMALPY